jgi:hypothetical protein
MVIDRVVKLIPGRRSGKQCHRGLLFFPDSKKRAGILTPPFSFQQHRSYPDAGTPGYAPDRIRDPQSAKHVRMGFDPYSKTLTDRSAGKEDGITAFLLCLRYLASLAEWRG